MIIFRLAPDQTIAQMWSNGARGGGDNVSEKMTNFLRRDRQIMSNARLRATSSAVKILA